MWQVEINADWTAVDIGFDKSEVLSTLPSPIKDFLISYVFAFKVRLLRILDNVKFVFVEYVLKPLVVRKVPRAVFNFGISELLTLFEVNILLYVKLVIASVTFNVIPSCTKAG